MFDQSGPFGFWEAGVTKPLRFTEQGVRKPPVSAVAHTPSQINMSPRTADSCTPEERLSTSRFWKMLGFDHQDFFLAEPFKIQVF